MKEERNRDNMKEIAEMYHKEKKYRLDNAATLFSLVSSKHITCIFRLSATFKQPIKLDLLQKAFENILPRFPYYCVNQRPGFSWYYWREVIGTPKVILDQRNPCQKMPLRKRGILPFRVRAYQNRIAVEFHHAITDGTGALTFLKALVGEYLRLSFNITVEDWGDVFRPEQTPHPEEFEDAFKVYYQKTIPEPLKITRAFHLPYKLEKAGVYHITAGIIPVREIIALSKKYNVSLTEFLSAVYIDTLQDILYSFPEKQQKRLKKPIRLMIPVNLRRIYPSKTMRNFSLYVTPGIDPRLGKFTFEEIVKEVYHYMRTEVNDKYINQQIKRNVRGELHPLMKATPLFIKKMFGKLIYYSLGEYLYSGVLTNLGKVSMPDPLNDYIQNFQFLPAPSPVTKSNCAIVSFKDKLYINFGRTIRESEVEKRFFRKLVKMGVPVKIETN
ncbi:MAG: hypothetical protein ACTSQE_09675 [Candidatus Heimdallarchaeaceae archaeon]